MKGIWTFILYIVLPLLALAFLLWLGWGGGLWTRHDLILKEIYGGNLGTVSSLNNVLEKQITVVNNGGNNIIVSKIYTDCLCLSVTVPIEDKVLGPFSLPIETNLKPLEIIMTPKGEMTVKFVLNVGNVHKQDFSGNIYIETLQDKEILRVPISAKIVP